MSFPVDLEAGETYALYLAGSGNSPLDGTLEFSDSGGSGGGFSTPVSTFACTGNDSSAGTASFSWTVPNYTSCSGGTSSMALTIQQSTDGKTWTNSTTSDPVNATDTTATVTGLSAGTNYQFRRLVPIGDNAGWSITVSVSTNTGALTAPTPEDFTGTTASWDTVSGASGYTVKLHRPNSSTVSYLTSSNSYIFTSGSSTSDFTSNGSYYFTVVANGDGTTTFDSAAGTSATYAYTADAPTITSISAFEGNYYSGDTISITVEFDQEVKVSGSGSNSFLLSVGGVAKSASYSTGSDSNKIQFEYFVGTGDKGAITVSGFSSAVTLVSTVSSTAADRTLPAENLSGVYATLPNQQPTFSTTSVNPSLLTSSTPVSLYSATDAAVGAEESDMGQKFSC